MNLPISILIMFITLFSSYFVTSLVFLKFVNIFHKKKKLSFRCIHISHRGGAGERLENSLPAFEHAVQMGTDMLEIDCHLSKDEKVVISHDNNLLRVTGDETYINECMYDELPPMKRRLSLDFKPSFQVYSAQDDVRIPLLEEVFRKYPNVAINIDIKVDNDILIEKVHDLIMKYERSHLTVWGNNGDVILKKCYNKDRRIPVYFSIKSVLKLVFFFYSGLLPFIPLKESLLEIPLPSSLIRQHNLSTKWKILLRIIHFVLISPVLFNHLHKRGIQTYIWVLNDEEEFYKAYNLGAAGVMTDFPSKLKEFLVENPHFRELPN